MSRRNRRRKNKEPSFSSIVDYENKQYKNDENGFNRFMNGKSDFNVKAFTRLIARDLYVNTNILETGYICDIEVEDIHMALKHPQNGWRILMAFSDALMRASPHYLRLNLFYANMAKFCWSVDLYGIKESANADNIKKNYISLIEKLETMSLKHEFSKIMKFLPYQDIFCGVVVENQNDFFIQQIDFRKCKLYEVQDGLYNFVIDLSSINPKKIDAYPLYIREVYNNYSNGLVAKWYKPPADLQICIKLNDQWTFPFPLLIGLVRDILDLDVYKKLKLQSARTDNYKAIISEVPIDKDTVDKPLLSSETLSAFAEINRESLTDDIGMLYSVGSKAAPISFKDSANTRNNVSDSVNDIYDSSGVSKELFNGSSSSTAVTLSLENDSAIVYKIYRQFERWVNRYIKLRKYNKSNYKFSFNLLDITVFNKDTVINRYKDSATLGIPVVDKYMASLDMTPSKILGSYVIHKNIFDFQNNFVPLQSSYNSNKENANGRPTNESKGELLSEAGEQTKDSDANKDR